MSSKSAGGRQSSESLSRAAILSPIPPYRKQALLVEARRNRVEWVDASSPYKTPNNRASKSSWTAIEKFLDDGGAAAEDEQVEGASSSSSTSISANDDLPLNRVGRQQQLAADVDSAPLVVSTTTTAPRDGMELLRKARACASMKSAVDIASTLYCHMSARQIEERVARQMMSQLSANDVKALLAGGSQIHKERDAATAIMLKNLPFVQKSIEGYQVFIQRLRSPEAADIVQGFKYFCSSLETSIQTKLVDQLMKKSQVACEAATSIHAYLDKHTKLLKSHILWEKDTNEEFHLNCKVAMETFLFEKFHKSLWSLTCDSEGDKDVGDKIRSLQFISWEHLDMECLVSSQVSSSSSSSADDAWSVALDALRFVDAQWSPTSKLVLYVEAYRAVTAALSTAKEGPPGADDSLPALILAILQANPDNIMSNLECIQTMARPDLLRGELGYVLTSVFSAIQFIMDLKDSSSLTISQEAFALGLSKCKEEKRKKEYDSMQVGSADLADTADYSFPIKGYVEISPRDVRMARSQGENVNLEWALNKCQAASSRLIERTDGHVGDSNTTTGESSHTAAVYSLPQGFTRTYSFLGVQPDDIRSSAIPALLHEYNQLVYVCEHLLTEKNAEFVAEHKRRLKMARDRLEHDAAAAAVDFSLSSRKS